MNRACTSRGEDIESRPPREACFFARIFFLISQVATSLLRLPHPESYSLFPRCSVYSSALIIA
jgi:hypothetical protein